MERATAHEIFTNVQSAAWREMERSNVGLFFSGLAGGLNISFGFMATAVAHGLAPEAYKEMLAAIVYPLGFLMVILPRAQLFTENTLTPVVVALEQPSAKTIGSTARIWGVVLAANLVGAFIAAMALAKLEVGTHVGSDAMHTLAMGSYTGGFGEHVVRGIFGAWLVATLVWMLHMGVSPVGEAILVWLTTGMIFFAGFNHSVAGAVEGMYLANTGAISYVQWLGNFQLPVTLGNAIGGVVFVALVHWGQAVGRGRDIAVAERQQVVQRVHEHVQTAEAEAAAQELVRREPVEDVKERLGAGGHEARRMVDEALDRSEVEHGDSPERDEEST